MNRTEEIDLHYPAKHLGSSLRERASMNDASVVDQYVHRSQGSPNGRDRPFHLVHVRDVTGQGDRFDPGAVERFPRLFQGAGRQI